MSREERFENRQWNDAVRDMKRAYTQLSDFDWKVEIDEPSSAVRHLRKMQKDIDAAMTHVAKVELGRDQQGAVDDVNRGLKDLNSAVTAIDDGNLDSAQRLYDKAATNFQKAAVILD